MVLFGEEETVEENTPSAEFLEPAEEFTHPRAMNTLLGHEEIERELLNLFNSGRMPHGLILSGPKGIGKATLAYKFTRFLFKHGASDPNLDSLFGDGAEDTPTSLDIAHDDPVFSKVASGGHPDLLTIERLYDATKNKTVEGLAVAELR